MAEAVIVAGARTPIGKLSGALAGFTAMDLGGFAIAEALSRAGVSPDQVDYVLMGQVILAGQGQITARQAAVKGGIPMTVPANTINKVCLSGLNTIYLADQMIRAGEADIVVAGGMESMTQAPHLLPGARAGFRIGDATLVDSMMYDGLTDSFDHIAMGLSTEQHNDKVGITRERQDAFAAPSHEKAAAAAKEGRLAEEIVPVQVPQRKGDPLLVDTDEGVRPGTTAESLGALKPAFRKDGTITAGNASPISDGGAAVVVMSAAKAKELGITPLERRDPELLGLGGGHHDDGRATVGDRRRVAGGDGAVLPECGLQCTERLGRGAGAHTLVGIDEERVTLALGHLHREDLLGRPAPLGRGGGLLVAGGGEGVLPVARDAHLVVVLLRGQPHGDVVEGVGEAVVHHGVDQGGVADAEAGAGTREEVRRLGHRLHAAGHHDLGVTGPDHLIGQVDGVEA